MTKTKKTTKLTTLKSAYEAGFALLQANEYGGEQVIIDNQLLVRNPKRAMSKTEWSENGYSVKPNAEPHCLMHSYGRDLTYPVYRDDQVIPKRKVTPKPPKEIPILAAVWVINRRAKRCRDLARKYYKQGKHQSAENSSIDTQDLYDLKSQALHYLMAEGVLKIVGFHKFPGGNWAEVVTGEGYTFHRPCPEPVAEIDHKQIEEIAAKPKGRTEPRIKDARHTIELYLSGKPKVLVHEWDLADGEEGDGDDDEDWNDDLDN